uniref:Uncharacterized protein n=1 Tax=Chenopodium quinoa TaxID=63459 RepID=A0A803LPJ1_CHEQI
MSTQELSAIGYDNKSPKFNGNNYAWWKNRIQNVIMGIDYECWLVVKNGPNIILKTDVEGNQVPKKDSELVTADHKLLEKNAKAMSILQQAIDLSNNIVISRKPIFCKPLLPEGYGPIINLPYFEPDEFVSRFDPGILRERIFHISSKAMSMLKAKANEECENINDHNVISSFQALCAFIWISITRVRNLEPSLMTICPFPLNWRARITPPLSQECFGNYVEGLQCACKVGDLLGHGLGSAALLIQQSVEAVDDSKIRQRLCSYVKAPFLAKTGSTYYEPNGVLIGGSARFDMYGPEFGLGKAVAVLAGYSNKADGKVTVNPGREGGSLDLEICLKPETMNALESDEEFMSFVLAK